MQPSPNPLLTAYGSKIREIVDTVSPVFTTRTALGEPVGPLAQAVRLWRPGEFSGKRSIPDQIEIIRQTLITLGDDVVALATTPDPRFTADAQAAAFRQLGDTALRTIGAITTDVLERNARIVAIARSAAYPARPDAAGNEFAQEAQLAALKQDLKMVWDSVNATDDVGTALYSAMGASLARAIGDGDDLAAWLIASSRWPEDYLTSRGLATLLVAWQQEVDRVLNADAPANLTDVRRAYNVLADGRDGLPCMQVLFAQLPSIITAITSWRPSAWSNLPPTQKWDDRGKVPSF